MDRRRNLVFFKKRGSSLNPIPASLLFICFGWCLFAVNLWLIAFAHRNHDALFKDSCVSKSITMLLKLLFRSIKLYLLAKNV